jgi:hypothetical protein
MKVKTESTPLEMGGVQVEGEFRIRNSAKAFSILSSGLYANKVEAILRELGCNAYDSHVEAGKADVPFTVHLPNNLNPQFYVRDYGIGLDHEGVTQLYTTYFESTKQDSNDYVGCLGLGSKSPFSYTRSFTVTAIKDGVERIYNCFINEQGIPSVALLNEKKTEQGNGVEVRFAVNNRSDMNEFATTARKVYKWFKVKPEIIGNAVSIPEVKYRERDIAPGVHIIESDGSGYYHRSQCYAQMGNVVYPIKLPENENVPKVVRDVIWHGSYMFEFPIGDLDVAASREELSYDPATVQAIVRRAEELLRSAGEFLLKETEKCKTEWERGCRLVELVQKDRNLFKPALDGVLGQLSPTLQRMIGKDRYSLDTFKMPVKSNLTNEKVAISHCYADIRNDGVSLRNIGAERNYSTNQPDIFNVSPTTIFVVQNDRGNMLGRIRQYAQDEDGIRDNQRFLIIRRARKDGDPEKVWQKVSKLLGNPTCIYSSDLPEVQNTVKTKSGEIKAYRFKKESRGGWSSDQIWKILPGPKKIGDFKKLGGRIIYIPLHGKQVKKPNGEVVPVRDIMTQMVNEDSGIFTIINKNRADKISPECIYGVNGASLKTATESSDWVSFFDIIVELVDKMDWKKLEDELEVAAKQEKMASLKSEFFLRSGLVERYERTGTPFAKLVESVKGAKSVAAAQAQLRALHRLERFLPDTSQKAKAIFEGVQKAEHEVEEMAREVKERYPMLAFVDSYGMNGEKVDAILNYLELVDKSNN